MGTLADRTGKQDALNSTAKYLCTPTTLMVNLQVIEM